MEHEELWDEIDQIRRKAHQAINHAAGATERQLADLRRQVSEVRATCAAQEEAIIWLAEREIERQGGPLLAEDLPPLVCEAMLKIIGM